MAAPIKDEDKPWSEMDLFDLENGLTRGDIIAKARRLPDAARGRGGAQGD